MAEGKILDVTPLARIVTYGDGYGDGYGYGYGYGDGYGDGSGYGSGYGYGDGSGYGDGYGDGSGYGYGYGDGYGYGYGYGDGYGDGSGDGSGYGYWLALLDTFTALWSLEQRARLQELREGGAVIALWKSDARVRPSNGGSGTVAHVGLREKIAGPLEICTRHALHATHNPPKWSGERLWVVALFGDVQQQEDKFGALEREILGECVFAEVA